MEPAAPPLVIRFLAEGEMRTFTLTGTRVSIGRGLDNRLVVPDPSVSRSHAEIRNLGGRWFVRDLGSTNGVGVNGEALTEGEIGIGDRLRVGSVDMTVEGPADAPEADEEEPDTTLLNATIVRRLEDLPIGLFGGPAAEKRQALEQAYGNDVFRYLTRLAGSLLTTDALDQVLRQVIGVAFEALPVDRGFIFLESGEATTGLTCRLARHGEEVETGEALEAPVSRTMLRAVVERRVALVTPDAAGDDRLVGAESVLLHQVRSALAAPLWSGQSVVGVMLLDSPSRVGTFTEQDVELATALANFAAVAIERIRYAERVDRERNLRARLERYHSPAVVGEVLSHEVVGGKVPPKEAEVTVLFADLVGFSTFAENAEPGEVTSLLDGFFDRAVEAIFEAGGTLDKFIGDCVMAFFGAPVAQDDHARRAVAAAAAIREAIATWSAERQAGGYPPVAVRVALNSGPVVVGEVGSDRRVDYTVLGNTVNVAARLEAYAAKPGDVVLSEATRQAVG
ncbi:MAG TPA: adenylate/guanylate cyclase domain-containing protein, partial [Thermoanaerobaculia bacterium]|nr:adenylate/guanylate cyclase domain-containing protein [Thermoanaerobaculia bacterium]